MYYANEGARDIVDFVTRSVRGGGSVLFDEACLRDAAAAVAAGR